MQDNIDIEKKNLSIVVKKVIERSKLLKEHYDTHDLDFSERRN